MRFTGFSRRTLLKAAAALCVVPQAARAGDITTIPAPMMDPPHSAASDTIVLAGGCFWGVQGVYQHTKGVTEAMSGYCGGDKAAAFYMLVATGRTDHAEAVKVTYDPREVSLGAILQIFFSVAHDPTQLNRQGPDRGRQYRSAIFPADARQAAIAKAYVAQLDAAKVYAAPIVTTFEAGKTFYPAEETHQNFMFENPTSDYIVYNDKPKVEALAKMFAARYRTEPVLIRKEPS
jgi:peptide-methionine (S)-S-oxide reductase